MICWIFTAVILTAAFCLAAYMAVGWLFPKGEWD
jgi:hypothetical protein